MCFVRPYLLYSAAAVDLVPKGQVEGPLIKIWKGTLKKIAGLPRCTPDDFILKLGGNPKAWLDYMATTTEKKLRQRFSSSASSEDPISPLKPSSFIRDVLKAIPRNFGTIFALTGQKCLKTQKPITHIAFCQRMGTSYIELQDTLFNNGTLKETKAKEFRRDLERNIQSTKKSFLRELKTNKAE